MSISFYSQIHNKIKGLPRSNGSSKISKVEGFDHNSLQKTTGNSVNDSGQAVILILNVRTSASKKINRMALIYVLTVSATVLERMREKFYGFQQTAKMVNFSPFIDFSHSEIAFCGVVNG